MQAQSQPHAHRGSIVFPFVLISIGVIFLLGNLGLLSTDIWFTLLRMWPVLLIAGGLDLLVGRRSLLGSLLVVLVLLAALLGAIYLSRADQPVDGQPLTAEQIAQPLGEATAAVVEIAPAVGDLRLGPADEGANLIEGRVMLGQGNKAETSFRQSGSTVYYTLRAEGNQTWIPGWQGDINLRDRQWDLRLNRDVPMDLRLKTGVGRTDADLARLHITRLRIEAGVGQTIVTLPAQGTVRVDINGGVGEVIVNIPAGMPARIEVERGLSSLNVSSAYPGSDGSYQSADYSGTADNRVELRIKSGIGNVIVREVRLP